MIRTPVLTVTFSIPPRLVDAKTSTTFRLFILPGLKLGG